MYEIGTSVETFLTLWNSIFELKLGELWDRCWIVESQFNLGEFSSSVKRKSKLMIVYIERSAISSICAVRPNIIFSLYKMNFLYRDKTLTLAVTKNLLYRHGE